MESSSEKGVNRYLTGGALVLLLLIVGYAFFSGGGILGGKFVAASVGECTSSIELQLSDTGRFVLREEGETFSSANVGYASSYPCADDGICTQEEGGFDDLIDDALAEAQDPWNQFKNSITYDCIKYQGFFYKSGSSAGGGPPADDGGGDKEGGDDGGTAGGGVGTDTTAKVSEIDWLDTTTADDWFIFKNADGNGFLWFLNKMANGMWVIMQLAFSDGSVPQTLDASSASGLGLSSLEGLPPDGQFSEGEASSFFSNVRSLVAPNGADSSGTDMSSLNDQLDLCGCEYEWEDAWSGTDQEGSRNCGTWYDTPSKCSNRVGCTWTCNDDDNDGIGDATDNCPTVSNADQKDFDNNFAGDACDDDDDGDGVKDELDNCPTTTQGKFKAKRGEINSVGCFTCLDEDDDGVCDVADNCKFDPNHGQDDLDNDGQGDVCDGDLDGDSHLNGLDNCPFVENNIQSNYDQDGYGDACDDDKDGDGVPNSDDECALTPLGTTVIGNGCPDEDGDGVQDSEDKCPNSATDAIVFKKGEATPDRAGCPECIDPDEYEPYYAGLGSIPKVYFECDWDEYFCNEEQACEPFPAECTDDSECDANFACGSGSNNNKCYTTCTQDSQCTDGFGCYNNKCLNTCTDDSDCSEGTKCSGYPSNVCVDTSGFCRESREIRLGPNKILVEPNSSKYDRSETDLSVYGAVSSGVLSSYPSDPVSGCIGVTNSHKYKVGSGYGGPTSNSLFYRGTYCPLYGGGSNDQYSQDTCTFDSECESGYICTPFYSTGESRCVSVKTGKDTCEIEGQSWYSACMWVGADCADIDTYDAGTGDWSSNKILCESYGCTFYEASCGVVSGAPEEYIDTCSTITNTEECTLNSYCKWNDYSLPWVGCYGGGDCSAITDSETCKGNSERIDVSGCEWITQFGIN